MESWQTCGRLGHGFPPQPAWSGHLFTSAPPCFTELYGSQQHIGLIRVIKRLNGFCGEQKGGNALCFLNGGAEALSEGKHADYCIVK